MKIKTVGKWLSRITSHEAETIEESRQLFSDLQREYSGYKQMKADSKTLFQDIWTNTAEFLRDRDLPDVAFVHWADDIRQWRPGRMALEGHELTLNSGAAPIDGYILTLGYQQDSFEHLAGRILSLCWYIDYFHGTDQEVLKAYRLGELTQLWKVYEYNEKNQFGSGRAKGRKRQKDAANYRKRMIDLWAKEEFRNSRQALAKPAKATITRARQSSVRAATNHYSDGALEKLLRSAQEAVLKELDRHA